MRSSVSGSRASSIPPPPVVMILLPLKMNAATSPSMPAGLPSQVAPSASVASSITFRPWRSRDRRDPRHVDRMAVEMHDEDRLRARRHRGLDGVGRHPVGDRVDVGEDRLGADVEDRVDRGHERQRGHDHLVARPDAGGQQREVQRGGAADDRADRGRRSVELREQRLELVARSAPWTRPSARRCTAAGRRARSPRRRGPRGGCARSNRVQVRLEGAQRARGRTRSCARGPRAAAPAAPSRSARGAASRRRSARTPRCWPGARARRPRPPAARRRRRSRASARPARRS